MRPISAWANCNLALNKFQTLNNSYCVFPLTIKHFAAIICKANFSQNFVALFIIFIFFNFYWLRLLLLLIVVVARARSQNKFFVCLTQITNFD